MNNRLPKLTGREMRKFDFFGWFMCAVGGLLLYFNIKLAMEDDPFKWWTVVLVLWVFYDYATRVAFGRVYQFVFFDTILRKLYKIQASSDMYYVCAENEEELALYMHLHYPNIEYTIEEESHVESFIRTDEHQ